MGAFQSGQRLDTLTEMLDPRSDRVRSGAFVLSEMSIKHGLPLLEHGFALLTHEDRWVRYHAYQAVIYFLSRTDPLRRAAVNEAMLSDADPLVRQMVGDLWEACYAPR